MNITEFGRVELDITKVPTSTVASRHEAESFDDQLSHVQDSRSKGELAQARERVDPRNPEVPEAHDVEAGAGRQTARDANRSAEAMAPGAPRDTTSLESTHRKHLEEGPVRQAAAGKDPGPSSYFQTHDPIRLAGQGSPAPAPSDQAAPQVLAGAGAPGAQQGLGSQPQSQPQAQPQAKAITEAPRSADRPGVQRSTAPAGYRTINLATLQAAQAARDSVIKQITLKLGPDGGEMRMRLDPPELGRLDIRMVVEKGAVLQLSIAAERPEVLMMLDKHMSELRNALSAQGLDLSGAEVETSLFQHRDPDGGSRSDLGEAGREANDEFETTPSLRRVGYVTAEGLDFWV